jgi:hypothetical protein
MAANENQQSAMAEGFDPKGCAFFLIGVYSLRWRPIQENESSFP